MGMITADSAGAERAEAVRAALPCMRHRGPDESDVWHDGDVVLGFNRLSIIDVEHSHQPLVFPPEDSPLGTAGRYRIVFNGEIYNYLELREELRSAHGVRFATEGDTEAIVAAYAVWGADAVSRLRGMFTFLVWDTVERVLFGARDPFGIKPLFFSAGRHGVALASEKKSLLALAHSLGEPTPAPDPTALQHYLQLQYVPEPVTLHRTIRRLESGCSFTVVPGEPLSVQRYFHPRFLERPVDDEQRLHHEITEVLRDSVAKHMRADVTVGAFLSGGIDSTAIAALAREHNPDLITFTSEFAREGYSEADVARESARSIGVRHEVRTVTAQEMMDVLPLIVWYLDEPVADPALIPLWFVAREARKHVKVVLSGEGADELFGGYTIYKEPLSLAPFERLPAAVRRLAVTLSTRLPEGMRGKDLLRRGALPLEERYYGNARIFRGDQLDGVLRGYDPGLSHVDVTAPLYADSGSWDPVARMQHVDLFTWLRGDILVKADKMTMANSLELRVPFLDREVFRVASTLPTAQKVSHDTTKYALRRAIEGIVPEHVIHRRKLGFPVPIRYWLAHDMLDWARTIIRESQTDAILDKAAVLQLVDEHRAGHAAERSWTSAAGPVDHSRRIWTLLVFMIWHGIFVEERIRPEIPEPQYPVYA